MKIAKKRKSRKSKLQKPAEDLMFYEKENIDEELSCTEAERDCFQEGEPADDKSIISRVKLF